jgi:antitoxin component of MazEF toxin-antitoxin module
MTLSIRPVRLKKSVYFRVPNDIADLINLEDDSQVTLTLEEKEDRHLLVYSVLKAKPLGHESQSEAYALTTPMQQSTSRARAANKQP